MPDTSFDVVVVGGGPAGLAAATCAAESGARTMLVDDNPRLGGQIWRAGVADIANTESKLWQQRLTRCAVRIAAGVQIVEGPERGLLIGEGASGSCAIRYSRLVLATGAREFLLPFPGWTLPNVCGAGGLQALVKGGLNVRGKRVAVAGTGPLLLVVASHLRKYGADVLLIGEQTDLPKLAKFSVYLCASPAKFRQAMTLRKELAGISLRTSCWPARARGNSQLEEVEFHCQGKLFTVHCDYLACGFGLIPNLELARLLGCVVRDGFVATDERQQTSVEGVYCAGEPTGIGGVDAAICEGQIAGFSAAGCESEARKLARKRERGKKFERLLQSTFALRPELRHLCRGDTLVCRCEDVSYRHVRAMRGWRQAKLQTRCGMGACQGRICGASTEFLFGWNAVHTRPPLFPTRVETLIVESSSSED